MRVAIYSAQPHEIALFTEHNRTHQHDLRFLNHHLREDTVDSLPDVDAVCCFVNDHLTAGVIDVLKQKSISLIALRSAGYNHVDIAHSKQTDMPVCRVPAYSPHAIAEHTVALILALNRKTHRAYNRIREGDFSLHGLMGFDLHGSTVGVIGYGQIGRTFAEIMQGFGCKVLAHDITKAPNANVNYVPLETLLRESDIVSLHCPLTKDTKHLINVNTIQQMKPGVMLINTSRGQIIDTKAVINALKKKHIGYLGIDVYEEEENLFFEDHSDEILQDDLFARLHTFPNVLITGHQAFFTKEAVRNIIATTLNNISNFENKTSPVYLVDT